MNCDNLRGHKLMTEELAKKIPALYATDEQELEPIAYVKLFSPHISWYWYILEYDGFDTCFGYVFGDFHEYGYFSLSELSESVYAKIVPAVERDLSFEPTPLSEVFKEHEKWKK